MGRALAVIRGFAVACHLMPTISVTLMVSLLGWRAGWSGFNLWLLFVAVLSGQLSVGWSNDAIDAPFDVAAARTAKPVVAGLISLKSLWVAAFAALGVTMATSFLAAGPIGGVFQGIAVASAWLYNLRLSRTTWSWVPYAISFGCVAPFLTYGLSPPVAPAAWAIAVFACTGVAAHLANALPDLAIDRQLGLGGLVSRIGAARAKMLALALLVVSSIILMVTMAQVNSVAVYGIVIATVLAAVTAIRPGGRQSFFLAVQGLALFYVLLILVTGVPITS